MLLGTARPWPIPVLSLSAGWPWASQRLWPSAQLLCAVLVQSACASWTLAKGPIILWEYSGRFFSVPLRPDIHTVPLWLQWLNAAAVSLLQGRAVQGELVKPPLTPRAWPGPPAPLCYSLCQQLVCSGGDVHIWMRKAPIGNKSTQQHHTKRQRLQLLFHFRHTRRCWIKFSGSLTVGLSFILPEGPFFQRMN